MSHRFVVALAALLMCLHLAPAQSMPLTEFPDLPAGTPVSYFTVNADRGIFSFDRETGLLTEDAGVSFTSAPNIAPGMLPAQIPGKFVWSLTVDEMGEVVEKGSGALYWDLGSGLQQVVTAEVVDLGSQFVGGYSCSDVDPMQCRWDTPVVSMRVTFEDPIVQTLVGISLGDWLTYRSSFQLTLGFPPLSQSFTCDREIDCRPYTFDNLIGYRVPEPPALGLLALGLVTLAGARWRRKS